MEETKYPILAAKGRSRRRALYLKWKNSLGLWAMLLPGFAILLIFSYGPMIGLYLAFVEYIPSRGVFGSTNVGFLWFEIMFSEPLLWQMVRNTLILSSIRIVILFPAPIILAFLVTEVGNRRFKTLFQSVSYLPTFISWIIVSSMMVILLDSDNGIMNNVIRIFNGTPVSWYSAPDKWYGILTVANLWKTVGWSTIIFIASLTAINPELYEAATIDGAGRMRQIWHISIPGISPTISIILILTIGKIFQDDFEQIYALVGDNPILSETTEVISTLVYKYANNGLVSQFPMATAMGLVQGVISLLLILLSNYTAKKVGYEGVW